MCSNMWASPVSPMGSCDDPASTKVKKEKTGASGRSQIRSVNPLGSFLTVMRFSNDATSWDAARVVRPAISKASMNMWRFIFNLRAISIPLDGHAGQKFESTWPGGRLSNGIKSGDFNAEDAEIAEMPQEEPGSPASLSRRSQRSLRFEFFAVSRLLPFCVRQLLRTNGASKNNHGARKGFQPWKFGEAPKAFES